VGEIEFSAFLALKYDTLAYFQTKVASIIIQVNTFRMITSQRLYGWKRRIPVGLARLIAPP